MIIQLQQSLKRYGLKVILWLILLSMAVGYLAVFFQKDNSARSADIVARVNNQTITMHDYATMLGIMQERFNFFKARFGAQAEALLAMMGIKNPQKEALNALISKQLLCAAAHTMHIAVDPEYAAGLLSNPAHLPMLMTDVLPLSVINQNQGSIEPYALTNYLKNSNQTYADLQRSIVQKVETNLVQSILQTTASVVPEQINQRLTERYQARAYDFFVLTIEKYRSAIQKTAISDQQLRTFFEQENKTNKRYWHPETRQAALYVFDAQHWGNQPSALAVENFYKNHKALFVAEPVKIQVRQILLTSSAQDSIEQQNQVQKRIEQLAEQLKQDPSSFENLVAQESQDVSSKAQAGLLEIFSKGTHEPAFERAAFGIKADGMISSAFQTAQGWHILQRVQRWPASYKSLSEVYDTIYQRLSAQDFKISFSQKLSKILSGSSIDTTLNALIIDKKAQTQELVRFSKSDQSLAARKTFGTAPKGWNFFFEANKAYLLHCQSVQPAKQRLFEECIDQVKQDYCQAQAAQEFNRIHKSLVLQLDKHPIMNADDFQSLAKQYDVSIEHSAVMTPADFDSVKAPDAVSDFLGFAWLIKPDQCGLITLQDKLLCARVSKTLPLSEELIKQKEGEINAQLLAQMSETTLKGFVASVHRNATITIVKEVGH